MECSEKRNQWLHENGFSENDVHTTEDGRDFVFDVDEEERSIKRYLDDIQ